MTPAYFSPLLGCIELNKENLTIPAYLWPPCSSFTAMSYNRSINDALIWHGWPLDSSWAMDTREWTYYTEGICSSAQAPMNMNFPIYFDQASDVASSTARSVHDRAVMAVLDGNIPSGGSGSASAAGGVRRSYMAPTKSANAKVRSQSTPKQRPSSTTSDVVDSSSASQPKRKRLSLPMKPSTGPLTKSPTLKCPESGGVTISPTLLKRDASRNQLPPIIMRYDRPATRSGELSMASSYSDLMRRPFRWILVDMARISIGSVNSSIDTFPSFNIWLR